MARIGFKFHKAESRSIKEVEKPVPIDDVTKSRFTLVLIRTQAGSYDELSSVVERCVDRSK